MPKKTEAIVVFTFKSVETILKDGGTQAWNLDRSHAKRCTFAVVCRNANSPHVQGSEPHGSAFMIGRIKDVVPSTHGPSRKAGRWLVTFSEYAIINVSGAWEGWRNPVKYAPLEELGIDVNEIEFIPMPERAEEDLPSTDTTFIEDEMEEMLTLDAARAGLARTLGVAAHEIEISIRTL